MTAGKILMEHWWNYTNRGKRKYSEKSLSYGHVFRHKFHKEIPTIEPDSPRWCAGDWPHDPWHGHSCMPLWWYTHMCIYKL